MGKLHDLLELQTTELKLGQLQKALKELPVFEEYKTLQAKSDDNKEAIGWAETKFSEHQQRVKRLELALQTAESELGEVREVLYGGTVQNSKELELMEKKSAALAKDQGEREEDLLMAMEGSDELKKALDIAKEELNAIKKRLKSLQKSGNERINELKDEIRIYREKRESLVEKIDKQLLDDYREKHKQYNGRPLAMLTGNLCSGCRVSVSSSTVSSMCRPDVIVHCENCGRFLVPVLP